MILNVVFALAFSFLFIYMACFFRFAYVFRRRYPEMWKALGCPEMFGLMGQATYLKVIFGIDKFISLRELPDIATLIRVIRFSLATAMLCFFVVAVMTG